MEAQNTQQLLNLDLIDQVETEFLEKNGGYLTMDNVLQLTKLRYLGKEKMKITRTKKVAEACTSYFSNPENPIETIRFAPRSTVYESTPDVWEAPAGMTGEELRNEVLIYKINNMNTLSYFEMKKLAAELGCEVYNNIKKEDLIKMIEAKKAELEAKKSEPAAKKSGRVEYDTDGKMAKVDMIATYSNEEEGIEEVKITKVCAKMAEFERADGSKKWSVWKYLKLDQEQISEAMTDEMIEEEQLS